MSEKIQMKSSILMEMLRYTRRSRSAMFGLFVICCFVFIAVAAPLIAPHDPLVQNLKGNLQPGFWANKGASLLGTDNFGRDILSRIIYGARISLTVGLVAVFIGVLLGMTAGVAAGFLGGWVDNLIMRIVDIMFSLPSILLAIVIVAILGRGLDKAMIAIGITYAPQIARVVRSQTIVVSNNEFIEAARAIGTSSLRIMVVHVLPNVLSVLIVYGTLSIGSAILDAAALGFLGLGAQPPTPEWGAMLADGIHSITGGYWWVETFPGIAILLTVLGFNLLGDGLRDATDPRLRRNA
jgi:ABC-type dipeptide/oligopeptide/nickel transport system permease subunit